MVEREQARPLAPPIERPSSDEDDTTQHHQTKRHRKFIKRCACPLISLLLLAIVIIVLIFTIFRVKDPIITMNGVQITNLELVNNSTIPQIGVNISLIADVSVKNPNVASFRYSNTTTSLYYHGAIVGEARGPPGRAKPRRTIRMNVTVDVITDRVVSSPNFVTDLGSGLLTVVSFSRVPGRVKILNVIKRHVVVDMNCTTTFNISSRGIEDQTCKRKVKL
ncbi:late embryogenesis abundant protein At1g64065 [Cajanus cajan]|uniref:Late embryogenesis abundant protein LEA-2 subgroup domain-containing protein n=1 Tax=Cajanus cajan TaxID=3821 RepID=A0A151UD87_CAJCA|nr:late embryogenesis abundant protein At1g64065 [Cajanus cajan]KYP77201.1 hypothetical protein KK1_021478 [Cajanus cajan]